jgi:tetratricopeptide (TPR) repeat protein
MVYGRLQSSVLGDNERAQELFEEGLRLARQLGDERAEARYFMALATTLHFGGENEQALLLHEQALASFRRLGDRDGVAHALHLFGDTLRDLGQFERAAEKYEESMALYESLGANVYTIHSVADAALDQRDTQRANNGYRRALALGIELDDKQTVAYCLAGLSCAAALSDDLQCAGTLWAAAELFEEAHGSRMHAFERARYERLLAEAKDAPPFVSSYERGRELTPERALEHALQAVSAST